MRKKIVVSKAVASRIRCKPSKNTQSERSHSVSSTPRSIRSVKITAPAQQMPRRCPENCHKLPYVPSLGCRVSDCHKKVGRIAADWPAGRQGGAASSRVACLPPHCRYSPKNTLQLAGFRGRRAPSEHCGRARIGPPCLPTPLRRARFRRSSGQNCPSEPFDILGRSSLSRKPNGRHTWCPDALGYLSLAGSFRCSASPRGTGTVAANG